jgi:hypothetical protein
MHFYSQLTPLMFQIKIILKEDYLILSFVVLHSN